MLVKHCTEVILKQGKYPLILSFLYWKRLVLFTPPPPLLKRCYVPVTRLACISRWTLIGKYQQESLLCPLKYDNHLIQIKGSQTTRKKMVIIWFENHNRLSLCNRKTRSDRLSIVLWWKADFTLYVHFMCLYLCIVSCILFNSRRNYGWNSGDVTYNSR